MSLILELVSVTIITLSICLLPSLISDRQSRKRREKEKTRQRNYTIAETIKKHFRMLRLSNRRYDDRMALLDLEAALYKYNNGDDIADYIFYYALSKVKGGDIIIEELKGMGA